MNNSVSDPMQSNIGCRFPSTAEEFLTVATGDMRHRAYADPLTGIVGLTCH